MCAGDAALAGAAGVLLAPGAPAQAPAQTWAADDAAEMERRLRVLRAASDGDGDNDGMEGTPTPPSTSAPPSTPPAPPPPSQSAAVAPGWRRLGAGSGWRPCPIGVYMPPPVAV